MLKIKFRFWYQVDLSELMNFYFTEIQLLWSVFSRIRTKYGPANSKYRHSAVVADSIFFTQTFSGNPDFPMSFINPATSTSSFVQTVQIVNAPAPGGDCSDKDPTCAYWESIGQCYTNSRFMKQSCPKICKMCTVGPPLDGGWTDWSASTSCSVCIIGNLDKFYKSVFDVTQKGYSPQVFM